MSSINDNIPAARDLASYVDIAYKDIEHTIKNRHSCRAYTDETIYATQVDDICKALRSLDTGLLGERAFFELERISKNPNKDTIIGTYGMVVNPHAAIRGRIESSELAYESYGFLLEHVVLKAEEIGLNTCWLGYYNNNGDENFLKSLNRISDNRDYTSNNHISPAIAMVGHGSAERGWWDKFSRKIVKPHTRKQFGELFYDSEFGKPLSVDSAGIGYEPLEMVRLAPSAGNVQPWRVIMDPETADSGLPVFHFYMRPSKRPDYNKLKLHNIDMGIAMCHFTIIADKLGQKGRWQVAPPGISVPENVSYTASWFPEGGSSQPNA